MRYFEISFSNVPDYVEGESDCYSICIQGKRMPSLEEAKCFTKADMERLKYRYVVDVREVSPEEAVQFFDMKDGTFRFPVFE